MDNDLDLNNALHRAKAMLEKGKTCPYYKPDHNGECLHCDDWLDEHGELTMDEQWQVYRLLASFTEVIETITPGICQLMLRLIEEGRRQDQEPNP